MYKPIKRTLDILIAIIALIILSPLFIIVIILLKLTGEGEVFYLQNRLGLHNKEFKIYKFATMLKNSLNMGSGSITVRNDPRVTKVGRILRKTKINELPQIINILIGDMSVVGPRPLVTRTFNAYPDEIRNEIYNVKPGLTGLGSIYYRDEEELISSATEEPHVFYEKVIAPYKGALEIYYQNNLCTFTDLKLIFATAWYILFPKSNLLNRLFKDLPSNPYEK